MSNRFVGLVRSVRRALRLLDRRSGQAIFWLCIVGIPLKACTGH